MVFRIILLLSLALTACNGVDPINTSKTNNPTAEVDTLFTKDGCTVYRFYDRMSFHYFVKCSNESTAISRQYCGKNCQKDEPIQTEYN